MYAPLALGASVWHLMNSVESPQHGPYRSLEGRPSTRLRGCVLAPFVRTSWP